MPRFQYKALTADKQTTTGVVEVASRAEALAKLGAERLTLLRLDEESASGRSEDQSGPGPEQVSISSKVRESFMRQLSSLLAAGVPLARSLDWLAREAVHAKARPVWRQLHDFVADGVSLADAMSRFPRVFPRIHTAMVNAGETGGFLDVVLEQIAEFQSRERELRARAFTALIYPIILAVLATAVVAFLLTFFIPRFEGIFADFGAALPPLTRFIVHISRWLRNWGLLGVLVLAVGFFSLRRWLGSEQGRRRWEALLLRTPVLGRLVGRLALTRFCRMLGTLTGAGVPLVTALRVSGESLGNQFLIDAMRQAVQRVQRGNRLADSLRECPVLFPGSVTEIISVAEQTARLDTELMRLAEVNEKELDRQLQAAVALVEPALLFVMAAVIGVIVIGMVLPIFALQDYIN